MISYEDANDLVSFGEAKWVVVKREYGVQEVDCRLCEGDKFSPSCKLCSGTGKVQIPVAWETYAEDIVLVNHRTKSNRNSTPRVPTCESKHIERAYVEGNEQAAKRIEEYGRLTQWLSHDFGAAISIRITGKSRGDDRQIHPGTAEPENKRVSYPPGTYTFKDGSKNKSWYWIETGRDLDYGRSI